VIGDVLDLVEAGYGVADVGGVAQGLLTLVGEGVDRGGELVSLFGVEYLVVFVMLPGCFHDGLHLVSRLRWRAGVLRKLGCDF
jgi:hypothetical protein